MNTTHNISIDLATLAMLAASLKDDELASLMRALVACASGDDAEPMLNTSGLRIAFALLSPPIVRSVKRVATLRANGAKGGRPRKRDKPSDSPTPLVPEPSPLVSAKKSNKEELSPTPPIEEKNKKNIITPSPIAQARDNDLKHGTATAAIVTPPVLEWEDLQRQMLNEQPWLDELCMSRRIRPEDMALYIADFIKFLRERDLHESLPHAKAHFVNQLPYIIKIYTNNNTSHHENNQRFIADPVARRQREQEARRQEVCAALTELAAKSQQPAIDPF